MTKKMLNQNWRQHFPTYHFDHRDIALEEYKVAAKNLESEERIFLNASNITLVSSAAVGSLVVGYSERLINIFDNVIPSVAISVMLLFVVVGFSLVTLKYFSDRQASIVFAARKVIVLRRMLGLNYGNIQLLLPKSRVEGADQPLDIKMFPGWFSYATYPFWMISIISSAVVFFLFAYFIKQNLFVAELYDRVIIVTAIPFLWFLISCVTYRIFLLDTHESFRLIFYKFLFKYVGMSVVENTEDTIYRARLAAFETERHSIELTNLSKFLIFIEDRSFYSHSGISYKSIIRGLLGLIGLKPKSGGSTIIQQLVRTLFVENMEKTVRRKLVELSLATWLNSILSKKEIIAIYLASVRFERGCFGIVAAMKYFFGAPILKPSNAQSFFLIERVSNVRSRLLFRKIIETVRIAKEKGLFSHKDAEELIDIYASAILNKKINASQQELMSLTEGILLEK